METFKKVPTGAVTLQEQAYAFIKEKIKNRDMLPGQQVADSQIAAMLNMSRTPVREALQHLEHDGFLVNQSGKGWKVYSLTIEDLRDIFDVKCQLEGMAAKKAAMNRDKKSHDQLNLIIASMRLANENEDLKTWQKSDMELHDVILTTGGNQQAFRIIKDLNDKWYRVRVGITAIDGAMNRALSEHEKIVQNILDGDAEQAEKSMQVHLTNVFSMLEKVLVHMVLPFAQNGI